MTSIMPAKTSTAAWLELDASVTTKTAKVGEPFTLVVEARHSPGSMALLPEEIALGDAFGERTAGRKHSRRTEGDVEIDRYELQVIPFEAGVLQMKSISLALGSTTADTLPVSIEVASNLQGDDALVAASTQAEAMAELESMAAQDPPPEVVLVPDYTLFGVLGTVLAVALFTWIMYRLGKRERKVVEPPPPPPRPAHEVANERLAALTVDEADLKGFFVELSEILRAYVGGRYGFDSLELTVDELMEATGARKGLDRRKLEAVLTRSDLVKFAKYRADVAQAEEALAEAKQIVHDTAPKEADSP